MDKPPSIPKKQINKAQETLDSLKNESRQFKLQNDMEEGQVKSLLTTARYDLFLMDSLSSVVRLLRTDIPLPKDIRMMIADLLDSDWGQSEYVIKGKKLRHMGKHSQTFVGKHEVEEFEDRIIFMIRKAGGNKRANVTSAIGKVHNILCKQRKEGRLYNPHEFSICVYEDENKHLEPITIRKLTAIWKRYRKNVDSFNKRHFINL